MYGNKKRHGEYLPLLTPAFRPSHCLYVRISNAASPRQATILTTKCYTAMYSNSWDIINPRRRLSLHYLLYIDSNFRSLKAQNDNVRKRLSLQPALQIASLASGFHNVLTCHILKRIGFVGHKDKKLILKLQIYAEKSNI